MFASFLQPSFPRLFYQINSTKKEVCTEFDSYKILEGGHAFFLAPSGDWKRSVGILVHKRWIGTSVKLQFNVLQSRAAFLDLDVDNLSLRLMTAHLTH